MAIKYTRPDAGEETSGAESRVDGADVRVRRLTTAPPSRKALSWIIIGTALIVTLLMIASELPALDVKNTPEEYVWLQGIVIPNESPEGERTLRVEITSENDEDPRVYDISLEGHKEWAMIAEENEVRIQVQLDGVGNINRILRVEPVEETTESEVVTE